jgi:diaminopimelate epimerase
MKTVKMHGCGNTFLVVDGYTPENLAYFAEKIVGDSDFIPDAVLFVSRPEDDFRMIYCGIDRGTHKATRLGMCGNGIRCFARYVKDEYNKGDSMRIITDDGPKDIFFVSDEEISVNMGPPREFCIIDPKRDIYFVNTSLAHIVRFMTIDIYSEDDLKSARNIGRKMAFDNRVIKKLGHKEGLHTNFVNIQNNQRIHIVTYEPDVGDLTLACGTGATASAYVSAKIKDLKYPITVKNRGGDLLVDMKERDLYLIGHAEYL